MLRYTQHDKEKCYQRKEKVKLPKRKGGINELWLEEKEVLKL